jgi:hypothetical protein
MKFKLVICVVFAAAFAFFASRSPIGPAQASDDRASEVSARIRPLGLSVVGQAVRQGSVYIVNALDARGAEMRVIVDAQNGGLISIRASPTVSSASGLYAYSPYYDASPRIINIAPVDDDNDDFTPARRNEPRRAIQRRTEPRQIDSRATEPHYVEPRRAVRQVVAPPLRPRDPLPQAALERAADTTANLAPPQISQQAALPTSREQTRRPFHSNVTTATPRPRTVLAPPPYADLGPTPLRPLRHGDSATATPPTDPAVDDRVTAPAPEDQLRSEARASVPQLMPQIPAPPRAVGLPVAPAEVEQKPAEIVPENPEDSLPPGTPTGDFGAKN